MIWRFRRTIEVEAVRWLGPPEVTGRGTSVDEIREWGCPLEPSEYWGRDGVEWPLIVGAEEMGRDVAEVGDWIVQGPFRGNFNVMSDESFQAAGHTLIGQVPPLPMAEAAEADAVRQLLRGAHLPCQAQGAGRCGQCENCRLAEIRRSWPAAEARSDRPHQGLEQGVLVRAISASRRHLETGADDGGRLLSELQRELSARLRESGEGI